MKNQFIVAAIMFCIPLGMPAQTINNNVIASGGTTLKKGNVQLEYTIGETCINTISNQSYTITQGFHQPNIIVARLSESESEVEGESDGENFANKSLLEQNGELALNVFPNPTTDFVNVNSASTDEINLTLIDVQGKVIQQLKHFSNQTQIDFTKLNTGTYFIIAQSANAKNTFKVIKQK